MASAHHFKENGPCTPSSFSTFAMSFANCAMAKSVSPSASAEPSLLMQSRPRPCGFATVRAACFCAPRGGWHDPRIGSHGPALHLVAGAHVGCYRCRAWVSRPQPVRHLGHLWWRDDLGLLRRRRSRGPSSARHCRKEGGLMVSWGIVIFIGLVLLLRDANPVTESKPRV